MNNWVRHISPLYKYFLLLCVTLVAPLETARERRAEMDFFFFFRFALLPLPVLQRNRHVLLISGGAANGEGPSGATKQEVIR